MHTHNAESWHVLRNRYVKGTGNDKILSFVIFDKSNDRLRMGQFDKRYEFENSNFFVARKFMVYQPRFIEYDSGGNQTWEKFLIGLMSLISVSVFAGEYSVNIKTLMSEFEHRAIAKDRCSVPNFHRMNQIANEMYVWIKFLDSLEKLNWINGIYNTNFLRMEHTPSLSEPEQPTLSDVHSALNAWYNRECASKPRRGWRTVLRELTNKD